MSRLSRLVAPLLLAFGLLTAVAPAQDLPPMEEGAAASEGNPLYGYLGTAFLGAAAIFVLCKSARR